MSDDPWWAGSNQDGYPPPGGISNWPGPPSPPSPPRNDRTRITGIVCASVLVVALLAAAVVVFLARSGSSPAPAAADQTPSTTTSTSNPSVSSTIPAPALVATGTPSTPSTTTSMSTSAPAVTVTVRPRPTRHRSDGAAQAASVDRLLSESSSMRARVLAALTDIARCESSDADIADLQQAAQVRRQLRTELVGLELTLLPHADTLRLQLGDLLDYSAAADDSYVSWAENEWDCYGDAYADSYKQTGDSYSVQATSAKQQFLALWNPIAVRYGLPVRSDGQI